MARFAMAGGYVFAVLVNSIRLRFFAAPCHLAFVASALYGAVWTRSLSSALYNRSHLDQVLFSVASSSCRGRQSDYLMGSAASS